MLPPEPPPEKLPRSPWRTALYAFFVVVVIGMIVGIAGFFAFADKGADAEQAGEKVGQAITPIAIVVAAGAYAWQAQKLKNRK